MALNLKLPKLFGAGKNADQPLDLDMPTTQVRAGTSGYDPLASVSIMDQLRAAKNEVAAPWRIPLIGHLPIVRQIPGAGWRHAAVSRPGGPDGDLRRAGGGAGRGDGVDGNRNADALATPRAGHRAGRAGTERRLRCGEGQPRTIPQRPRPAAGGGYCQGRVARRRAGRFDDEDAAGDQGTLGPGRRERRARPRQPAEPHLARQGTRDHQPGQYGDPGARAAGGAADRPGRRQSARGRVREPARRAVAADRQERQRARVVRGNRSRGRVPARQGRRHVPRDPERPPQGQRGAAAAGRPQRRGAHDAGGAHEAVRQLRRRRERDPAEHEPAGHGEAGGTRR